MELEPPDPPGDLKNHEYDNNCQNSSKQLKRKLRPKYSAEQFITPLVPKSNLSYLLVKREDGKPMCDLSPFLIDKLLINSCGSIKNAKKLKDGSLLVETWSTEQGERLKRNLPQNIHIKLTVEPHKTLNSVRGVITCKDLNLVSLEEIKESLKYEGVTDIYRINRKINGTPQPTNTYVVTLSLSTLPERLKIGYYSVPVRPYIPLPTRCYNCFKFTHSTKYCPEEKPICPQCCEEKHEKTCEKPAKCVNCNGPHSTLDRTCPRWVLEKKITEIKILEKIPYLDAKRKVISSQVQQAKTYASLTKTQQPLTESREQATQCDLPLLMPTANTKPYKTTSIKSNIISETTISPNLDPLSTLTVLGSNTKTSTPSLSSTIKDKPKQLNKSDVKTGKKETKQNQKNKSLSKCEPQKPLSKKDFLINSQEEKKMMWVDDWTISSEELNTSDENFPVHPLEENCKMWADDWASCSDEGTISLKSPSLKSDSTSSTSSTKQDKKKKKKQYY